MKPWESRLSDFSRMIVQLNFGLGVFLFISSHQLRNHSRIAGNKAVEGLWCHHHKNNPLKVPMCVIRWSWRRHFFWCNSWTFWNSESQVFPGFSRRAKSLVRNICGRHASCDEFPRRVRFSWSADWAVKLKLLQKLLQKLKLGTIFLLY